MQEIKTEEELIEFLELQDANDVFKESAAVRIFTLFAVARCCYDTKTEENAADCAVGDLQELFDDLDVVFDDRYPLLYLRYQGKNASVYVGFVFGGEVYRKLTKKEEEKSEEK